MSAKNNLDNDLHKVLASISKLNYINPDDIPDISLYMDQVTTFMEEKLSSYKRYEEDKTLTKTMINNYAKNQLIPPPEKKKYTKKHMLLLIFIYYFKNFLSISDIKSIFKPISDNFFGDDSEIDLEYIYKYVFDLEFEGMEILIRDVTKKYKLAKGAFPKTSNEDDDDVLSTFAFICMLGFDVYVKKLMIETLIDSKNNNKTQKEKETK
ncbi:MAG: DUF1836 domain-containing protein [Lachnospiraceae bacterium]